MDKLSERTSKWLYGAKLRMKAFITIEAKRTVGDAIQIIEDLSDKVAQLEERLLEYAKLADTHEENQSLLFAEIEALEAGGE